MLTKFIHPRPVKNMFEWTTFDLSMRDLYMNPSESIQIEYFKIFGLTN